MIDWGRRDWIWLVSILIAIIILILSLLLLKVDSVGGYISVASTSLSIALALIAIFISLVQSAESRRLNQMTTVLMYQITMSINSINEKMIDKKDLQNAIKENLKDGNFDYSKFMKDIEEITRKNSTPKFG